MASAMATLGGLRLSGLLLIVGLFLMAASGHAGTQKFALILGNNEGRNLSETLRYAEQDAKKMRRVLVEYAHFSKHDVGILLGSDAQSTRHALAGMEARMRNRKRHTNDKVLFVFYYSGHANNQGLELGATTLGWNELKTELKELADSVSADLSIAILDACQSGAMIGTRGGYRAPGFPIRFEDELESRGYAILTSSSRNELSQESEEIGGGFFTHYFVEAIMGDGDENDDGSVTLTEAYEYAHRHTLAHTNTPNAVPQHAGFDYGFQGSGAVVLSHSDRLNARVAVTLPESGTLFLINEKGSSAVKEAEIKANTTTVIAIPPGEYRAVLHSENGEAMRLASVAVGGAGEATIEDSDFQTVSKPDYKVTNRGRIEVDHRVGAGALVRRWPSEWSGGYDGPVVLGPSFYYRVVLPNHLELNLLKLSLTLPGNDIGIDLEVMAGIGYALDTRFAVLRAQGYMGYSQLIATSAVDIRTFNWVGFVGLEKPFASRFFFAFDVGLGARFGTKNEQKETEQVRKLDYQVLVSVGRRLL